MCYVRFQLPSRKQDQWDKQRYIYQNRSFIFKLFILHLFAKHRHRIKNRHLNFEKQCLCESFMELKDLRLSNRVSGENRSRALYKIETSIRELNQCRLYVWNALYKYKSIAIRTFSFLCTHTRGTSSPLSPLFLFFLFLPSTLFFSYVHYFFVLC